MILYFLIDSKPLHRSDGPESHPARHFPANAPFPAEYPHQPHETFPLSPPPAPGPAARRGGQAAARNDRRPGRGADRPTPFSPPSGPLMSFLKHLPAKSNFLAVKQSPRNQHQHKYTMKMKKFKATQSNSKQLKAIQSKANT
jgi:hypothetical protein